MKVSTRKIVLCAIFAAICCVTTLVVAIPAFYTKGYVNLGDVSVILSAYIIGGGYGAFAAGFGSALADVSMSFYQYAPVTLVVKALMTVIAAFLFKKAEKTQSKKSQNVQIVAGVVLAEFFMIFGYFLYELVIYKKGAFASLPGNGIQAVVCSVISIMVVMLLKGNSFIQKIRKNIK